MIIKSVHGKSVEIRGEQYFVSDEVAYFPIQRILIIGDFNRWYDHYQDDGWNPDLVKYIPNSVYYDLNDEKESIRALHDLFKYALVKGKDTVKMDFKAVMGL